jgi:hypothetical protein
VFLVNEQGIEVYKSNGFLQPGSNKMILPVRYQSGTYYVKIISSSSKASIKVYVLE